ncbi:transglycosylase domain-containing protein [Streptomyces sp. NPDC098789]|uniref:transglycosylase domain-containing protein n=1 Tax=Streptomyces sp. NPDC098789 TaxID=3366098 RepID=UPI00382A627F
MTQDTPPTAADDRARAWSRRRQRNRSGRPPKPPRTGRRRWIPRWRWVVGSSTVVLLLGMGAVITAYMMVAVPDEAKAAATAQSNVFLYSDGSVLARTGAFNRQNVPLSDVPKSVQDAVLAAEDRRFYSEPAIDPQGMLRAAWNMTTGSPAQSGSTITQQYVKNTYLEQNQTLTRKAKEMVISVKLAHEVSKQDILQGYLNTSYFGRDAYGIQAAAQAYYGKNVSQVTPAEGAYLASLLNAPSAYDVITDPQARPDALARWNYILDGMVKEHWLGAHDRAAMTFPEPVKPTQSAGLSGQRGYLVEAATQYLVAHDVVTKEALARGGYRITTTIDRKREDDFVKAVQDTVTSRLDEGRAADRNVRVGGVSIDPATGRVVALYGGVDYTEQFVDNATRHDSTPGSTFKPLVLAAALADHARTQGGQLITPDTVYNGDDKTPVQGSAVPYAPENEDRASYGPISVRVATDKSVNSVYAQMAVDVGPAEVKRTAVAMGIPDDLSAFGANPSLALGVAQASVLDMTQAYATLAAHGTYTPYSLVDSVSRGGKDLSLPDRTPSRAIPREAADTTTSVLRSTVASGTAEAAGAIGRDAAAKTGTAENDQAALFAGYTPDLATVVSVMGQDPDNGQLRPLYGALGLDRVNGGGPPGQVWAAYTRAALRGSTAVPFDLQVMRGGSSGAAFDPTPPTPPGKGKRKPTPPGSSAVPETDDGPTDLPDGPTPPPTPPATPTPPPGGVPDGGGNGGGGDGVLPGPGPNRGSG